VEIKDIISSGLLELYITGITSNEETLQVEQWANQYPEVKKEIEELQQVMENYAMAEAIQPDKSFKEKILAKIAPDNSVKENTFSKNTSPANQDTFSVTKEHTKTDGAKVYSMPSYFKWAAAASVILLFGSLILSYTYYNKYHSANKNLQITQKQLNEQNKLITLALQQSQQQKQGKDSAQDKLENEKLTADQIRNQLQHQKEVAEGMKRDISVMTDKYSLPVVLKGTPHAPDALAKIFWMKNSGDVYVDPRNLPETPAGKQYQLWAIVDGKPVNAGMISTEKGIYHIQKMKSFGKAQAFAITLEKSGGNLTPTMDQMVVQAKI
jgi:hypothetical protein